MFCPNCGNEMKNGGEFCSNCGYKKNINITIKKNMVKVYLMAGVIIISFIVLMLAAVSRKNSFVSQLKSIIDEKPTYIDIADKYVAWELNMEPNHSKAELLEEWDEYFYEFASVITWQPLLNCTPLKINERDYFVLFWLNSEHCYPLVISIRYYGKNNITVKMRDVDKNDAISIEKVKKCIKDSLNSKNNSMNFMYYKLVEHKLLEEEIELIEILLEIEEEVKNGQKLILELNDNDFEKLIKSGGYFDTREGKIIESDGLQDYFDKISLQFVYDKVSKCWKWIPNHVDEIGDLLGQF